jgi:hypothetical protein
LSLCFTQFNRHVALNEYIEQTYDIDSEPIICINCDTRFNTELKHKLHDHEKHQMDWGLN